MPQATANPYEQQKNVPLSPEEQERSRLEKIEKDNRNRERIGKTIESFGDKLTDKEIHDALPPYVRTEVQKAFLEKIKNPLRKKESVKSSERSRETHEKTPEHRVTISEFGNISKLWGETTKELLKQEQLKTQEVQKEYAKKYGKLLLLRSIAEAYRDYLSDIRGNIRFKSLSNKPQNYAKQEAAISTVIAAIDATLSDPSPSKIKALDLKSMVDAVFIPETKLTTGIMNQPMVEYDTESRKTSLNNPFSLEETEGRYAKMKSLILEGYGKDDPSDNASLQKRKVEILGLLRKNDSRDDDPAGLNSAEAIRKQLEDDVLSNKDIRKNLDTAKVFDSLLALKYNPKAVGEFAKVAFDPKVLPDTRKIDGFFRSKGIALPEKMLSELVSSISEASSKRHASIDYQVKELEKQAGLLPKAEAEAFAKDKRAYFEIQLGLQASMVVLQAVRRNVANDLVSRVPNISSVRTSDEALKLYTNIEGIGGKKSDKDTNERVRLGEWIGEQLAIMYVSGGIGNAIGNTSKLAALADGAGWITAKLALGSAKMEPWMRGIGVGTVRTVTEGVPFAVSYSTLDGLAKWEVVDGNFLQRVTEIMNSSNTVDGNLRITAFLGVIKSLAPFIKMVPNPKEWVSSIASKTIPGFSENIAPKLAKMPNAVSVPAEKMAQALQNVTLDTTALLGADTVIRFARSEDLPKSFGDVPNYVTQETMAILPFAIGLRAMSKSMAHNAHEPIKIEIRANGNAVVEAGGKVAVVPKEVRQAPIAKDIAQTQKDIRRLQQSRNIERNRGNAAEGRAISRTITEKKHNLRALKEKYKDVSWENPDINPAENRVVTTIQNPISREEFTGTGTLQSKHTETRSVLEDSEFSKTSTNHSATNIANFEYNVKNPTLSETVSGFNPKAVVEWRVSAKFQELLEGMGNIESEALLKAQAETVVRSEFKRLYDEVVNNPNGISPEARARLNEWLKDVSSQAERLANEFTEAVKAKMRNEPMKKEWGEVKYLWEVIGKFVEKANPAFRKSTNPKNDENFIY